MACNFKLSAFSDEASPDLQLQLAALKQNGLNYMEIRGVNSKPIVDYSVDEAKEISKTLSDNGVFVSALASPFGKIKITDDFEPHLEHLKRGLEIAGILGTKRIRLFSFYIPEGEAAQNYRGEVLSRMEIMTQECKKAGILPCHENEKGIYGDTPERCIDLLDNVEDLFAVFDPANFIQCGVDALKAWEMLASRINYLHIKDSKLDGTIVPAGHGAGHIAEISADYLKGTQDDKLITIEPHLKGFSGLESLEAAGGALKHEFEYETNLDAFNAAVTAVKGIL